MRNDAPPQYRVREAAQRCLDEGGPVLFLGRTDKWSGRQLGFPDIQGTMFICEGAEALEEQLVKDAFAEYRRSYLEACQRLVEINTPVAAVAS